MKKKITALFFLLVGLNVTAQNWKLLDENKTYFYKHSDSLLITNTIKIDSTVNSALDSVFHIHTTIKVCDTCSVIPSDAVGGVLYHAFAPEIFGNTPTYNVSSNDYQFSDGIIKQNAELSDTWIFNPSLSINATVADKYETTLFGSLDSVKVIELSTLDTILISKNHGVIRYPDFENAGKYFLLCGFHEGQNSYGEYLPNMWRIYDFNVGDVFCFRLEDYSGAFWTVDSRHVRLKILENLSTPTTIAYKVKLYISRSEVNQSWDPWLYNNSATNYIDTFTLEELESCYESTYSGIIDKFSDLDHNLSFYNLPYFPNEVISSDYIFEGNFHALTTHKFDLNFGYQKTFVPFYLLSDSTGYFSSSFYNSWFATYTEGIGRDSLNFYGFEAGSLNELIGYIKNGDTTGFIYDFPEDLATPIYEANALKIYPNPASDQIHLPENLQRISFINISSQEVLSSENPNQTIFVGDLPKGIYLVQSIDANGNLSTTKLIIE